MFCILLVEDNPGDVLLFREALRDRDLAFELVVAEDGEKAINFLAVGLADLIVLDVNLPKHSGQEVLRRVRTNPALAGVPVVVLTSSASPIDRAKAIGSGADLYLQKSSNLDEILEIGKTVEDLLKRGIRGVSREPNCQ
jgi:CheY-like chemotaxis protein